MRTSENITNISAALLSAQKKIEAVKKGAVNPYFKSRYADLPSVMEACKKPLNDNGVVILQPIMGDFVETRLIHADSGEWMSSRTRIVCKTDNDPQAYGSAITYARRYGLQSMIFLSAEDDDGEGAMNRQTEARRSSPLKEKTATKSENKELVRESTEKPEPSFTTQDGTLATANCGICGQHMNYREGTSSKNGKRFKWTALFCESGEKDHAVWSPKLPAGG